MTGERREKRPGGKMAIKKRNGRGKKNMSAEK